MTTKAHAHGEYCYFDHATCTDCWGEGRIVDCIDDLCATSDECIHGDGYAICSTCEGRGETRVCVYEAAS